MAKEFPSAQELGPSIQSQNKIGNLKQSHDEYAKKTLFKTRNN